MRAVPRAMTRFAAVVGCALLAACGGDPEPEVASQNPPDQPNRPPVWDEAPAEALLLEQGRELRIPLALSDPDGDPVTSVVSASTPGLDAITADAELILFAGYGATTPATFQVTIADDAGLTATYDVPVDVRPLRWLGHHTWTTANGPEEREHGTAIFDAEAQQAFVMQGSGYHPQFEQMLDDVWRYDLATQSWAQVTPTGDVPEAAGSRRFAGAWGEKEGYLFGGYGPPPSAFADLVRVRVVDGTLDFETVPQVDAPLARYLHGFVFDPVSQKFFLFGGVSNSVFGDTWSMTIEDGTAVWTRLDLSPRPSPRYGFFYGFDEEAGRMIVFSGAGSPSGGNPVNAAPDTWALDTRSDPPVWSQIATGSPGPAGRRNGCGVWDARGSRLFVFGGTADAATTEPGLFVLDARPGKEAWSELSLDAAPPARSSGFGFFDGQSAWMGFGNGNALHRDWAVLGH